MLPDRVPANLPLHLALALFQGPLPPLTPAQLADALWWMDRQLWVEQGEGLWAEDWVWVDDGVDLASLAPLRTGQVPEAWQPWWAITEGRIEPTVVFADPEEALDELSPHWWAIVARTRQQTPPTWAADRTHPVSPMVPGSMGHPLSVPAILTWCGDPLAKDPTWMAQCEERRSLQRAMARYT
jgi:hypothetical protein